MILDLTEDDTKLCVPGLRQALTPRDVLAENRQLRHTLRTLVEHMGCNCAENECFTHQEIDKARKTTLVAPNSNAKA